MADITEAIIRPKELPPQGVDVDRLGLPNCIWVLDEPFVLLLCAPLLPRDGKLIIVGKVHLRRLHRCVHCHTPTVIKVTAVEG